MSVPVWCLMVSGTCFHLESFWWAFLWSLDWAKHREMGWSRWSTLIFWNQIEGLWVRVCFLDRPFSIRSQAISVCFETVFLWTYKWAVIETIYVLSVRVSDSSEWKKKASYSIIKVTTLWGSHVKAKRRTCKKWRKGYQRREIWRRRGSPGVRCIWEMYGEDEREFEIFRRRDSHMRR